MKEIITSLDNPAVKEARSLLQKKYRKFYGKFLVDGEKLVYEVVCGAGEVDKIFVDSKRLSEFGYILERFDGEVIATTQKVINSISENVTPQGIIAEVFMRPTLEFGVEKDEPILVLDRIQDPGNLGTIIRTAAATGFKTLALIDTVDPYSSKVVRSSAGGVFYLDLFKMSQEEIINYLRKKQIPIFVADMDGENIFKRSALPTGIALVIGNEGGGVSSELKACGELISLPMKEQMESLNAGVSASVLMYMIMGKRI